jgi:hypothetical protein
MLLPSADGHSATFASADCANGVGLGRRRLDVARGVGLTAADGLARTRARPRLSRARTRPHDSSTTTHERPSCAAARARSSIPKDRRLPQRARPQFRRAGIVGGDCAPLHTRLSSPPDTTMRLVTTPGAYALLSAARARKASHIDIRGDRLCCSPSRVAARSSTASATAGWRRARTRCGSRRQMAPRDASACGRHRALGLPASRSARSSARALHAQSFEPAGAPGLDQRRTIGGRRNPHRRSRTTRHSAGLAGLRPWATMCLCAACALLAAPRRMALLAAAGRARRRVPTVPMTLSLLLRC